MIPGQAQQFFEGAASASGDSYQIDRSLRFNAANTPELSRTPSSTGDTRTFTYSCWVKRFNPDAGSLAFILNASTSTYFQIYFSADGFYVQDPSFYVQLSRKFSDVSAWYHIVVTVDTPQAAASDRLKIYVNGEEQTDFAVDQRSSFLQNTSTAINSTQIHKIGPQTGGAQHTNVYLAEAHLVDGTALTASDFGQTDTNGVWQPKEYVGSYGTNGFYLKFADNSSDAALGTDSSGNGHTWTVSNINAAAVLTTEVTAAWAGYTGAWSTSDTWSSLGVSTGIGQNGGSKGYSTTTESWANAKTFTGGEFGAGIRGSNGWALRYPSSTTITIDPGSQAYISDLVVCPDETTDIASGTSITTFPATVTGQVFWLRYTGSGYPAVQAYGTTTNPGPTTADSVIDTPTNYAAGSGNNGGNYCTLNALEKGDYATVSNGSLDQTGGATDFSGKRGTFSMASGKWYWEVTINGTNSVAPGPGILATDVPNYENPVSTRRTYYNDGTKFDGTQTSYGASFTTGDVIGVAFDADAGDLTFYKNGVSQGVAFSGLTAGPYSPYTADYNGSTSSHNFGQQTFQYTPPTNYVSLCTENLPTPGIANGSTANNAILYTGDATNGRAITGLGFSPDLVWIKARNQIDGHIWCDIVRGTDEIIKSNNTNAEFTATNSLTSFDSDGFTVGDNSTNAQSNQSGFTYVAWAWDGGSSTVSNSDGSVTANVRANASAGFSIAKWTPVSSASTVGHGLNAAPEFILTKDLDNAYGWICYHKSVGTGKYLELHSTNAAATLSSIFTTAPTSTVFDPGTLITSSSGYGEQIAYCWAPVEGYSAFGTYVGSQNFQFVNCGFRPSFLLIKPTDLASGWQVYDSKRNTYNRLDKYLAPNAADAEVTSTSNNEFDFYSNGFVPRGVSTSGSNYTGYTFSYMAFAEHPFKTARAR